MILRELRSKSLRNIGLDYIYFEVGFVFLRPPELSLSQIVAEVWKNLFFALGTVLSVSKT